jgi:NADPH2:quinone reductase
VHAATGGDGADVVIDTIGDRFFNAALRALAWRGRLVVGFAAGEIPTLKANYLLVKNIEVSGLQISDYRKRVPADVAACFAEIFDLHARGLIRAPATTVLPLDGAAEALRLLRDRQASTRLILAPGAA